MSAETEYQRDWYRKNLERNRELCRNYKRRNSEKTKEKSRQAREYIKQRRAEIGCADCGERHPACLDFHHVNGEKSAPIGRMSSSASRERLDAEIAKCIVLCSNCHRKKHHDARTGQWAT